MAFSVQGLLKKETAAESDRCKSGLGDAAFERMMIMTRIILTFLGSFEHAIRSNDLAYVTGS